MNLDSRTVVLAVTTIAVLGAGCTAVTAPSAETESPTQTELVVTDTDDEPLLAVPVEIGDAVVLEYTHSVEKTTVRDIYEVHEDGIVMTQMEFQSFGAGLPSSADVEKTENGTFVYEPSETEVRSLFVSPGEQAGHELLVGDQRYDLVEMADEGTIVLTVETTRGGQ